MSWNGDWDENDTDNYTPYDPDYEYNGSDGDDAPDEEDED